MWRKLKKLELLAWLQHALSAIEPSRRITTNCSLMEAKATGADLLITACPKCQIHWKCVTSEKLPVNSNEVTMEMRDLSVLAAEAMKLI